MFNLFNFYGNSNSLENGGDVGGSFLHLFKLTYPDGFYIVQSYDGEYMSPKDAMEKMQIRPKYFKSYKYKGVSSQNPKYREWNNRKNIGYSNTEAWDEVFENEEYAKGGGVGETKHTKYQIRIDLLQNGVAVPVGDGYVSSGVYEGRYRDEDTFEIKHNGEWKVAESVDWEIAEIKIAYGGGVGSLTKTIQINTQSINEFLELLNEKGFKKPKFIKNVKEVEGKFPYPVNYAIYEVTAETPFQKELLTEFFHKYKFAEGGGIGKVEGKFSKAQRLLLKNIKYSWRNTDMGSGWEFTLYAPFSTSGYGKDVLAEKMYLDTFELPDDFEEDEDSEYYYQEWKEDLWQNSFEDFKDMAFEEHLDFFKEALQRDRDNYAEGGVFPVNKPVNLNNKRLEQEINSYFYEWDKSRLKEQPFFQFSVGKASDGGHYIQFLRDKYYYQDNVEQRDSDARKIELFAEGGGVSESTFWRVSGTITDLDGKDYKISKVVISKTEDEAVEKVIENFEENYHIADGYNLEAIEMHEEGGSLDDSEKVSGTAYYVTTESAGDDYKYLSSAVMTKDEFDDYITEGKILSRYFSIRVTKSWQVIDRIYQQMEEEGDLEKGTHIIGYEVSYYGEKEIEDELPYKTERIYEEDDDEEYAKGGKVRRKKPLSDKYNYVPNYMIQEVEVERNGKTTNIDGSDILDGFYVKKGVKYAKGGAAKSDTKFSIGSQRIGSKDFYFIYNSETGKKSRLFSSKQKAEDELNTGLNYKYALGLK